MKRTWIVRAAGVGLALTLAAPLAAASAGATPTRAPAAAPTGDIVATAQAAGQFTVLLEAAQKAGLVDALKGPGPFTVFAPTDAAFTAALTKLGITKDQLLNSGPILAAILKYHVLSGAVPSSAITGPLGPTTLEGRQILVVPKDGKVTLNLSATVVTADVQATNGVIHVIDQVLLPPVQQPDIVDTAAAAGSFSTLLAAAKAAGLVDALKAPGPYTVFAPTDAAFSTLLRRLGTTPEKLLADPVKLASILKYHVVSGEVFSTQLKVGRNVVSTLNGNRLVVRKYRNGRVTVNGTSLVTKADIDASNGVIHVINRVLVPKS